MKHRMTGLLFAVLIVAGCKTVVAPRTVDPVTGGFPTSTKLMPDDIKVVKPFLAKFKTLVYIKTPYLTGTEEPFKEFNSQPFLNAGLVGLAASSSVTTPQERTLIEFYAQSFRNMGIFAKVVTQPELESMVKEHKLSDKIQNLSDMATLNQLQKEIGPFLIVDPFFAKRGSNRFKASNYYATLEAIDPESGETVLHLKQLVNQSAWSRSLAPENYDELLFFPLLNGVMQWAKGEEISTATKH